MISFDNVTINKNQMNSEECMYLTDFVPRVARVDLHKFMHQGPGRPFLPHYRHIVRNKNAIWLPSIAVAEIQVFQNVNGIPECKAVHLHNFKCAGNTVARSKVKGMKQLVNSRIGQLFRSEVAPSQNVFRYDDDDDNVYNEHPRLNPIPFASLPSYAILSVDLFRLSNNVPILGAAITVETASADQSSIPLSWSTAS